LPKAVDPDHSMAKVVVTDASYPALDRERAVADRHGAHFVAAQCRSPKDVIEAVKDADVVLVQYAKITDEVLAHIRPNALVVRYGLGLDNIDLAAARRRGIRVAHVPDYAIGEVADHTVALILTALRKIIPLDRSVRAGVWDASGVCAPLPSCAESCVGFIGFGRIGRQVYERLKPFGFAALVSDPSTSAREIQKLGAEAIDLDALFAQADVLTLHAPLNSQTRHLVNARRLSSMKRTAVIVNTARGGLIDTVALEDALASGKVAGAALDVFEQEPLPESSRLRTLANVILTPHAAWYSEAAAERIQALAADEVDRALSGQPPRCPAPIN
jgi:D-3-phosphoglycerate dehydrogenase / 2-oxoglutarate reductase